MKIKFDNKNGVNLYRFLRKCGYRPRVSSQYHTSYVRSIGSKGEYPHFHIYIRRQDHLVALLLHLDMKKPSYAGAHAHNAEYSGKEVAAEATRLQSLLAERNIKAEITE